MSTYVPDPSYLNQIRYTGFETVHQLRDELPVPPPYNYCNPLSQTLNWPVVQLVFIFHLDIT